MVLLLSGKRRQRWSQVLWPIVKVKRSPFTRGCNRTARSIFTWLSASVPLSVARRTPGSSGTLMAGLMFSTPPSIGPPAARINLATPLTFRFTRTPGTENIARPPLRSTRETDFSDSHPVNYVLSNHLLGNWSATLTLTTAARVVLPFHSAKRGMAADKKRD